MMLWLSTMLAVGFLVWLASWGVRGRTHVVLCMLIAIGIPLLANGTAWVARELDPEGTDAP